jgi:SAM-dependent methyltransferase
MQLAPELSCLAHRLPVLADDGAARITAATRYLGCPAGCRVAVVRGIARFVASDGYAAAFGRQWRAFRRTQLDSFTGTTISRARLARCLGGSLEAVAGKTVLEVGCGAGRFTELLLAAGARVVACDLSAAVEANYENCRGAAGYFVCQADLRRLPLRPGAFDIVLCLGVIQHTPDPEAAIAALGDFVKPGGLLAIDHYRYGAEDMTPARQWLRRCLIRCPPRVAMGVVRVMVAMLWPLHRLLWRGRARAGITKLRRRWLAVSPVLDYHEYYAALGPRLLYAWAALDTHDALTDRYKHKRTVDEIRRCLDEIGLEAIEAYYGGNGVEARARKPAPAL